MPTHGFDRSHAFRDNRAVQALNEFRQAERDTAGVIHDTIAMDSAAAVYSAGLSALGVDPVEMARTGGVPALRAVFLAHRRGGGRSARVAMDVGSVASRAERFPNGGRLK